VRRCRRLPRNAHASLSAHELAGAVGSSFLVAFAFAPQTDDAGGGSWATVTWSTMTMDDVGRDLPPARLVRGASRLSYRAQQLSGVVLLEDIRGSARDRLTINNALVESALVNARALSYFLTARVHNPKNNLHHSDYSATAWTSQSNDIMDVAEAIIGAASEFLAHASPGDPADTEPEPHPGQWPLIEIAVVLTRAFGDFVEVLEKAHVDRAGWFCPRPTQTYGALIVTDPLVKRTPISDHPRVGELTQLLQARLDARRPVPSAEALDHARRHTARVDDGSWYHERWTRGAVEVGRLRTAHSDFRGAPITKQALLADVLRAHRDEIEAGTFPEADTIRTLPSAIPAVMVEVDDAGELFVADGQCRVMSGLWHQIETVEAYVYHRRGVRELPPSGSTDSTTSHD
jgi:hypothetical protein